MNEYVSVTTGGVKKAVVLKVMQKKRCVKRHVGELVHDLEITLLAVYVQIMSPDGLEIPAPNKLLIDTVTLSRTSLVVQKKTSSTTSPTPRSV